MLASRYVLLSTRHACHCQFATYEEIKKGCRGFNGGGEHLSTMQTLGASSLSKVKATGGRELGKG